MEWISTSAASSYRLDERSTTAQPLRKWNIPVSGLISFMFFLQTHLRQGYCRFANVAHLEEAMTKFVPTPPATPRQFRKFQDVATPPFYDTAFSYFSRRLPFAFSLLEDPVNDVEADLGTLALRSLAMGKEIKIVEAPTALKERGKHRTLAFPMLVMARYYVLPSYARRKKKRPTDAGQ